jgi:hypothetical protein
LPGNPSGGTLNQEQLEQILAPIALYPDALLAQILMASTYPLEIVQADRWVKANPGVQGKALEDALQKQPWDPSVKSLSAFPQVLGMMNEKLAWTQQLGDAFLADQKRLMAAVQKLRRAADAQGNLKSGEQLKVTVEPGSSTEERIIIIEPADPQVVYVPAYDPWVVYGAWPYPAYPPYYYYPPGYYAGGALWGFTAGIIVGGALWGGCNWRGGNVHIEHHTYNNFNWRHNAEHRGGVPYRDQRVAQQYNRGANSRDAQARDQFRGRAESGRSGLGQRSDGGPQASAFGGADSARRSSDFGSRGSASRSGSSFGGGFGGGRGGGFGGGGRGGRR